MVGCFALLASALDPKLVLLMMCALKLNEINKSL